MANPTIGGADLLTLQAVLEYCHNWWFNPEKIYQGDYTISDGELSGLSDYVQHGQYFRIVGSVFNDGLHQSGDTENPLVDEQFNGAIWPLSIPPAVIAIAGDIKDWQTKYGAAADSPYNSESFSGYSYSKSSGTSGESAGGWQAAFKGRLARWRKL